MKRSETTGHGQHRGAFGLVALLLATGCGGSNVTDFQADADGNAIGLPDAPEAGPVRASLEVDGTDLVVSLENTSNYDASVSLQVFVTTPSINSSNDAGSLELEARQAIRYVIPANALDGFDIGGSDWLRAELHYRFELDSGIAGTRLTGLAAQAGTIVPRAEAIERGLQIADTLLEGGVLVDKGPSFRICFKNHVTFANTPGFSSDGLTPNLVGPAGSTNTVDVPMPGQFFYAYNPTTSTTPTTSGTLDANGCTPAIPRKGSGAEQWKFRPILYAFTSPWGVLALDNTGQTPGLDVIVNVPSSGNPADKFLTFASTAGGDQQILQSATFLSNNSVLRVGTALGITPGTSLLLIMTGATGQSHYCATRDTTVDCPQAQSIRVKTGDANDRELIPHETGHWIHNRVIGIDYARDYNYSQADAQNPSDGSICRQKRSADGTHSDLSIEWQSAAHTEAIANLFLAVTYNRTDQADCTVRGFSCESVGKSMSVGPCIEWTSSTLFGQTGNEMDWLKMYWDYITDSPRGTFSTYMSAERNVKDAASQSPPNPTWPTGLGHGDHWGPIYKQLQRLSATEASRFLTATSGNVFDGSAH